MTVKAKYRYPNDPVTNVQVMFGAEFTARYPNREIAITVGTRKVFQHPVTDVVCDTCNAEIGPLDPCAVAIERMYCWGCFTEWIRPHVL